MSESFINVPAATLPQVPAYWWDKLLDGGLYYVRLEQFHFKVDHGLLTSYLYRRAYARKLRVSTKCDYSYEYPGVYVQAYAPADYVRGWSPDQLAVAQDAPQIPFIRRRVPVDANGNPDPNWSLVRTDPDRLPPHMRAHSNPSYRLSPPEPVGKPVLPVPTQPTPASVIPPDYDARKDPENDWFFEACDCGAATTVLYDHPLSCPIWKH